MATIDEHQAYLQAAILDVLSFAAVFRVALSEDEIWQYLAVPVGRVPLHAALESLVRAKRVARIGRYYGLARLQYPNPHGQRSRQGELLAHGRRWARLMGLIPTVKAVVAINGTALGKVRPDSGIDLLIVTKPGRLYVSKATLMGGLKLGRQLKSKEQKRNKFGLRIFISTNSVNFSKDILQINEPLLDYWLAWSRPLYGAALWWELLRRQADFAHRFPNLAAPEPHFAAFGHGWRLLDRLESTTYRRHLKRTSAQAENRRPEAFIRLRPDIINLHPHDRSAEVAADYERYRTKYHFKS